MTAYSLCIIEFPADGDHALLESSALRAPVAQSLSDFAAECSPYRLASWAEARGHTLYYVDNCWVRARVHGRDVAAFFAQLSGEPLLPSHILPDQEYLIEAEEY